MNFEEAYLIH